MLHFPVVPKFSDCRSTISPVEQFLTTWKLDVLYLLVQFLLLKLTVEHSHSHVFLISGLPACISRKHQMQLSVLIKNMLREVL